MSLPGRLVILGHPVAHALSPTFQNAALKHAGIPLTYEAMDVTPARLATVAGLLRDVRGAGNITVPHKESFAKLCGRLSPVAERTGAVNTFWTADGVIVGDNTDVGGFDAAINYHFGAPCDRLKVAVLGAGGAAAAVLAAVERWAGASVALHGRSRARANALAARFNRIATAVGSVAEAVDGAELVVNATPVGLHGDDLPCNPALLGAKTDAFDLTYRLIETPWVLSCRARGLRAADGLTMVVEQGALAFERWFEMPADRSVMYRAVGRRR
jgi:shikimate dehydrogenase